MVWFIPGKVIIEKYKWIIFEGKFIKEYKMFKFNEINKFFSPTYINCALNMNVNMWQQCLWYTMYYTRLWKKTFDKYKPYFYGKVDKKLFPSSIIQATEIL